MRRALGLWMCSAIAAAAACSTWEELTAEESVDVSLQQTCDLAFDCRATFPGGATGFAAVYGASVDECLPRIAALFGRDRMLDAIERGTIAYDASDAQVCLDAQLELSCAELWDEQNQSAPAE